MTAAPTWSLQAALVIPLPYNAQSSRNIHALRAVWKLIQADVDDLTQHGRPFDTKLSGFLGPYFARHPSVRLVYSVRAVYRDVRGS